MERIGFEFLEKVSIPGDKAPRSMKRDADGKVHGDKFRFPPTAVNALLDWFEHDFKDTLGDGKTPAHFDITGRIGTLREALREAVKDLHT